MPPTLRSATNTPTKAAAPVPSDEAEDSPKRTPRKEHRCTKCHRPRAGHPRSGCPFTDETNTSPNAVTNALESLNLESSPPVKQLEEETLPLEDTKQAIRDRRRSSTQAAGFAASASLESLSTTASGIVNNLLQPGLLDNTDTDEEDPEGKVMRWQMKNFNFNYTPSKPKRPTRKEAQRLMPGTLVTPETSYASVPNIYPELPPAADSDSASSGLDDAYEPHPQLQPHNIPLPPSTTTTRTSTTSAASVATQTRHLGRTMSMEEQSMFISQLRNMSKVSAYHLPLSDIPTVQANAMKVGLHAHLVRVEGREGLLVIGRDGRAVQELVQKLETDVKVSGGTRANGFKNVVGGAVVGAAATFAGLAFA